MKAYVIVNGQKCGPMEFYEARKDADVFRKYGYKVNIEKIDEE